MLLLDPRHLYLHALFQLVQDSQSLVTVEKGGFVEGLQVQQCVVVLQCDLQATNDFCLHHTGNVIEAVACDSWGHYFVSNEDTINCMTSGPFSPYDRDHLAMQFCAIGLTVARSKANAKGPTFGVVALRDLRLAILQLLLQLVLLEALPVLPSLVFLPDLLDELGARMERADDGGDGCDDLSCTGKKTRLV